MLDLAQNMLRSLDAVPADLPRLVVGMGSGVCEGLGEFWNTACIDIYRDSVPEEEVAWGSREYYQVVLRKHVVLTIVSLSGLAKDVVFSDPDIVYFANPGTAFRTETGGGSRHHVFSQQLPRARCRERRRTGTRV
ncbi:unnamed protein product [Prorocentrum cordatum]|uniref:Nucleotide-diphospho-sugar transferase domain-containing protein n=1 Tax=Prorocentrum cordatum TaxID=2364126 RepID=A0ABN9XAF3_9DINO|nr:unnamed protein product [Polarella glacialis]